MRHCQKCNGSGTILVSSVNVKDAATFLAAVVEAFIPYAGKRIRCPRCRGRGYYQPIKTNYR